MTFTYVTYRIVCESSGAGVSGKAINVFHVTSGAATTLGDAVLNGVLTDIKALYTAAGPYLSTNWSIGTRVLEFLPGGTAPVIRNVAAQNVSGTGGSAQAPQLAAVLSWRTPLAGPAFRGRTFFGPLGASGIAFNVLAPAFLTAINAAAATMITALQARITGNGGLVVRSLVHQLDTPVTSANMNNKIDTLRKRA